MPPPIVGIGASAGGLEAFTRLIRHIPPHTGLAYVLVQHLDPDHESMLPELLAREASIPVLRVVDGVKILADHAYVIPPNTTMTVTDGHLKLAERKKLRTPPMPIDGFLSSLAETHQSGALGVILSGTGSDGARGIAAIKAAGGITIAQNAASARFASMPESAVATGHVDFVLPPEEIAEKLVKIGRHIVERPAEPPPSPDDDGELNKILQLLYSRTGVDFRNYRRNTVHRRILRRMLLHRRDTQQEYLEFLRTNPSELDALYEDMLIDVTSFFRDPQVFETLQTKAFPRMMQNREPETPVRAWIAGCAGGEETYSIAMSLLEFLGDGATEVPVQIFATDLSNTSIAKARAGLYPEGIEESVSPERLRRFFVKEDAGYRISKSVRDLCVFSRQNVIRDPPFSHLDLISCRNVLIYLEPHAQKRVFPIFHYALKTNGVLLLGSAESAGASSPYFEPLDKRHRIYLRRRNGAGSLDVELAVPGLEESVAARARPARLEERSHEDVNSEADRLIMARFAPAGVVVNSTLDIVQFRGQTAPFLEHGSGTASLNLLKLARQELAGPLRSAIHTADSEGRPTREEDIRLKERGKLVTIEVIPFRSTFSRGRFFVVTFAEQDGRPRPAEGTETADSKGKAARTRRERSSMKELREELAATRGYLQDVIEEYEATNEELRAANEEVQSSNEELQSANEELETTKEEIQSTNEELNTVNEELRHRNMELASTTSDLSNVLASSQIPIVIVDSSVALKRFTPAAEKIMKVIPTDAGRPLNDVKLRVDIPDLDARIVNTIETLTPFETEVRDDEGHWWSLAVRPYQGIDRRVDGAVLVFNDIDAAKRYTARAEEAAETRRQLLAQSEQARTEADLARDVAEMANRAKGAFLASMSHDLRTPLNAIAGYVDLLELGIRGPVTPAQHADFARIKRSSQHLLSIINDILNFAKVEAGHLDVRVSDVVLEEVVSELEALLDPQLRAKPLSFRRDECNVVARADPERLRQILLNLTTNAIKFTPAGGSISISCGVADGVVSLAVADTGVGIPPDQLNRIFEPFVQVNRTLTSPNPEGVGLGLAISRDLARLMGGDLLAESTVGEGSRFTLTLPLGDSARVA